VTKSEEVEKALYYVYKFKSRELTQSEFKQAVRLKFFRLCAFYFIKDKDGNKVRFSPNIAQVEYYKNSHQNDIILKARQLGFTTFKMLHDLDSCLFKKNFSAGCIAHNEKDSKDIFRNKIKFAFQNIQPSILRMLELLGYRFPSPVNDKDNMYVFSNGSSIGVSTGYRGGTLQSLHVSEFGKICKKYPEKAKEIVTGAFNAVGKNGSKTIESTAEGKAGYFYDYCQESEKRQAKGITPASMQFKFHFFSWWMDPEYRISESVEIPDRLDRYFDELKSKHGINLDLEQKRWYALIEQTQGEDMKREYPSTPREAFEQAIEGAYYANQFAAIYKDGRICDFSANGMVNNDAEVHTAWDIGIGDSTAIWFYRLVGEDVQVIHYYENSGESMGHYIKYVHDIGDRNKWSYGQHWGPHDINNREFASKGKTRKELAKEGVEYNGKTYALKFDVVPKLGVMDGIEQARLILAKCVFDEKETEQGVKCLEHYRKEWNEKLGTWRDQPLHDWSSHGADAFRYLSVVVSRRINKPLGRITFA
jgi:hypothetical protein